MNNTILLPKTSFTYEQHISFTKELPFIFHFNIETSNAPCNIHENIEVLYFLEGEGYVQCDNESYPIKAGDIVVIDSYMVHQVIPKEKVVFACLIIDNGFCKSNNLDTTVLQFTRKIQDQNLNVLMQTVCDEYSTHQSFEFFAIRCAVLNVLLYLCRNYAFPRTSFEQISGASFNYIRLATDYIKSNLSKKLSIDAIAASAGLSKYHFVREFKKITGCTVIEYLNIVRCEHAQELLTSGKYKIKEVAILCGFDNFSYFSSVYKKYTGILPSDVNQGLKK